MKPTYKKMLAAMEQKEKKRRNTSAPKEAWFVYILQCKDGTLYTGIAKDLQKRFQAHNNGKGAKYTRTRRPVSLHYQETCRGRTEALIREYEIKTYSRSKKEALISTAPLKKNA